MLVKRGPYWATLISLNVIGAVIAVFAPEALLILWMLLAAVVWIGVFIGRCTDAGVSRWLVVLLFIPLIGLFVVIGLGIRSSAAQGEPE